MKGFTLVHKDRSGILAAGHFIVDHVKTIDSYPLQDQLSYVKSHTSSNGGGAFNVLIDLARMGSEFPLHAIGCLGADTDGEWVIDNCRRHGATVDALCQTSTTGTSWTDVMSVQSTGRRTFFHYPGVNDELCIDDYDFPASNARIFHLAYLTLLPALDAFDEEGRTAASRVFEKASASGLITSADLVSRNQPDFRRIVASSAPYLDYLLLNELEAGWIVGRDLTDPQNNISSVSSAAESILDIGIRRAVVLHFAHGAVYVGRDGRQIVQPALQISYEDIRSALGAGDAFAAGFLHAVHEQKDAADCLHLGVCTAAACLFDISTSGGIRSVKDNLALAKKYGYRVL